MFEDIWIVIPAYEEEAMIPSVIEGLQEEGYDKVLVVDDGSEDDTAKVAESAGAEVVIHEANMGLGAAIRTGLNEILKREGDVAVTFDADGQHDPKDVKRLIERLEEASVVIGERHRDEMPINKRFGNFILDFFTFMFGGPWTDSQSGLRAFDREALGKIEIKSNQYAVSSEIMIQVGERNLDFDTIPIEGVFTEYSMSSGTTIASGIKIFLDLLKLKVLP
ncbi:MAG: glycosyltransferase family 2 protein [Candidatus Hadarchaeota archaeon]